MAGRYKKILVPLDGSDWSEQVIPNALDIARANEAQLILVHVYHPPTPAFIDEIQTDDIDDALTETKARLMALRDRLQHEGVSVSLQLIGGLTVAATLQSYILSEAVDLVVMASHGRTGLMRLVLGSVAREVMEAVDVPIIMLRPGKDTADDTT